MRFRKRRTPHPERCSPLPGSATAPAGRADFLASGPDYARSQRPIRAINSRTGAGVVHPRSSMRGLFDLFFRVLLVPVTVAVAIVIVIITDRLNDPEQAVLFVVRTRGEIQVRRDARDAAINAEGQAPQTVNRDGTVFIPFEHASEVAVSNEGHDRAAAEIADQQLIGVFAEG